MKISNQHIMFISEAEVKQICQPLFKLFGITYFNYMRVYHDGSFSILTTHAVRDKYLFEQDYKESMDYESTLYTNKEGYVLWTDGEKFLNSQRQKELIRKKIFEGASYFNVGNGIAFFEKYKNFTDYYQFGTNPQNESIIPIYLSHYDDLKLFIAFFKEKACSLIKLSHKNTIILPRLKKIVEINKVKDTLQIEKEKFLKLIKVKRYYLEAGSKKYLTERELACLAAIARGMKQKEVARLLQVSPRTVEYFLEKIKQKLGLYNINQIIEMYWNSLMPKNIDSLKIDVSTSDR